MSDSLLAVRYTDLDRNRERYFDTIKLWAEIGGYAVEYPDCNGKWRVTMPEGPTMDIGYWWIVDIAKGIETRYNKVKV